MDVWDAERPGRIPTQSVGTRVIGAEAYRSAKAGDHSETIEAIELFLNVAEITMNREFFDEFNIGAKESHMMREIPMIIEKFIHRFNKRERTVNIIRTRDIQS